MLVYNIEPLDYSKKAIRLWKAKGYDYKSGSWDEIITKKSFPKVSVLIVRLKNIVDKNFLDKFPNLIY